MTRALQYLLYMFHNNYTLCASLTVSAHQSVCVHCDWLHAEFPLRVPRVPFDTRAQNYANCEVLQTFKCMRKTAPAASAAIVFCGMRIRDLLTSC